MNSQILFQGTLAALTACAVLLILRSLNMRKPSLDSLPWVGVRNELFAKTRANLREWKEAIAFLDEGYVKVR
jgi:hypothetical protein